MIGREALRREGVRREGVRDEGVTSEGLGSESFTSEALVNSITSLNHYTLAISSHKEHRFHFKTVIMRS